MNACPNCHVSYPANYTHCPRDGSALIEAGSWQEGTTVRGKYRILCKLGEGGMAVVYKAMHMRFEEMRALKVMNAELAGDHAFVKRFMQEAVLTRKIQHPNAVRVDDIDEAEDGRPFMVMEFLDGRGLKDVIEAEAPMAPARVSRIARQIAGALDAAHRLGVVHRDVKPANIVLVTPDPLSGFADGGEQAKVLDFGIAKAKEARLEETMRTQATLTGTGNVIGTPTYMSPEQAGGMRGANLDGRSDLYSLGIVMYRMLSGGLPFKAETSMEWILAHLQTPPMSFREFRPDLQIPPALTEVVMRCLEKDPGRRPPTAGALIEELEQAELTMPDASVQPVFSSRTGRTWAEPAVSSGARRGLSTGGYSTSSQTAAGRGVAEATLKPSRRWMGWSAGALALLLAGAIGIWMVQRSMAAKAGASELPAANQDALAAQPTGQPATQATGQRSPQPASGQTGTAANGGAAATQAATEPAMQNVAAASGAPSATLPVAARASAGEPSLMAGGAAHAQLKTGANKPPGFLTAVLRAKDDESQGRFEDALRNYQQASALDPSDASVKRHIALLRDRISKENDLIR